MEQYEHGGDIYGNTAVTLDFSVNTNPLGMPNEIRQAIVEHMDEYSQYPDPKSRRLVTDISAYENIPVEWILCGNGAAELIYRLCYALKPQRALVCAPTFSEYERALLQVDCQVIYHALSAEEEFELGADIINSLAMDIDILFICNPNNPTGRLISGAVLEKILTFAHGNGIVVVIDECFLGFTNAASSKSYLQNMPDLLILKAFTKMYAVAGLRLGYLMSANAELLKKAGNIGQIWSVSIPAQIAGIAALDCKGWEEKTRSIVSAEREFMRERLGAMGIKVFKSDANFLLFKCEQPLYEALLKKGILIRVCANYRGLDNSYYRVSVKTRTENERLLQELKEIANDFDFFLYLR